MSGTLKGAPNFDAIAAESGQLTADGLKTIWLALADSQASSHRLMRSNIVSQETQLRCSAFNSAVQAVGTGAFASLTLDSEDFDRYDMHSLAVNTSRITVPTGADGLYMAVGGCRIAASAAAQVALQITISGTALRVNSLTGNAAITLDAFVVAFANAVGGDYFELQGFQNSGGNVNFGGTVTQTESRLVVVKLEPNV